MATMDILNPSNWEGTDAGRIEYSNETVGWLGSYYHSDGLVILNSCSATAGIRIRDILFNYNNVRNFPEEYYSQDAYLTVSIGSVYSYGYYSYGSTIFAGSIQGLTHQELPSYNELELSGSLSLRFESVQDWNSYMYVQGGGDGNSVFTFNLNALSFTYADNAPTYRWRDYVDSQEQAG